MALRMASLTPNKTGGLIARKAIPADVRAQYKQLHGVSREAILRVPVGTPKSQAKAQHGQWLAEVETRIERIRAAAKGEGQPLTKLNALALAGRWYAWFVERHQSDLRSPKHWSSRKDHFIWQVLSPHAPEEHHEPHADPSWPWVNWPEVRAATAGQVREIETTYGIITSAERHEP